MNPEELRGKDVLVVFRRPLPVLNGVTITSIGGNCGGVSVPFIVLNNIAKVQSLDDDVTDRLGVRGKTMMFNTRAVQFIFAE